MAEKIKWTTGPVSSSLGYDSTLIVVTNGSNKRQKVWVSFYDLSYSPKKLLLEKVLNLAPGETGEVDTERPEVFRSSWEVQISSYSSRIRSWVSGRRLTYNLPGNTVLSSQLQRF